MTIQLKVLYFGSARDQTGVKEEDFRIAEGTTLKGFVERKYTSSADAILAAACPLLAL